MKPIAIKPTWLCSDSLLIEWVQNEVCSSHRRRDTAIFVKHVCWYPMRRNETRRKRCVFLTLPAPNLHNRVMWLCKKTAAHLQTCFMKIAASCLLCETQTFCACLIDNESLYTFTLISLRIVLLRIHLTTFINHFGTTFKIFYTGGKK